MARRKRLTLRKVPTQERARASVDAILQAAAYILKKDGWARLTTNRVAERAGVNIASLYQYFPNKEAIAHELHRRFLAEVHTQMTQESFPTIDTDLRSIIRAGTGFALKSVALNPEMHRVFMEELPRSARRSDVLDPEVLLAFKGVATKRMKGVPDPDLAYWMWNKVMAGLVRAACAERPELLTEPAFAEEIAVLLERFLDRET